MNTQTTCTLDDYANHKMLKIIIACIESTKYNKKSNLLDFLKNMTTMY